VTRQEPMGERYAESIVLFVVAYVWLVLVVLVVRAVEKMQMLRLGLFNISVYAEFRR